MTEISKLIGAEWRELDEEDKEVHDQNFLFISHAKHWQLLRFHLIAGRDCCICPNFESNSVLDEQKYKELAKADKARYKKEMESYTPPEDEDEDEEAAE